MTFWEEVIQSYYEKILREEISLKTTIDDMMWNGLLGSEKGPVVGLLSTENLQVPYSAKDLLTS